MNKIRNNIGTGLRIGYTFTQTAHVINIYMNKETDRRQTGRQRDKEKRRCSSVAHRSLRFYWERDTASPKWRHTKKYNKQQRPKKKKKSCSLVADVRVPFSEHGFASPDRGKARNISCPSPMPRPGRAPMSLYDKRWMILIWPRSNNVQRPSLISRSFVAKRKKKW